MTSLADIARLCNVSPSTASRALRNHPHVNVRTRQAVKTVAESLDYRMNAAARSLVTGKSNLIAFVHTARDVYWDDVSLVARRILHTRHLIPIACLTDGSPEWEKELLEALLSHLVAGIIWQPCPNSDIENIAAMAAKVSTPMVMLDCLVPNCPGSFVYTDDLTGAAAAARYIVAEGHRRIALLVGPQEYQTMRWRKEGFLAALDEAEIPRKQIDVIEAPFEFAGVRKLTREMLSRPSRPTAILTTQDEQAWGALEAARDLGIRVPEDLRIVGYGDYLPAHYTRCGLTTVLQDREQIVGEAVAALAEKMESSYPCRHKEIPVTVKLVIRDT